MQGGDHKRAYRYLVLTLLIAFAAGCSSPVHVLSGSGTDTFEKDGVDFVQLKDGTLIEGEVSKDNLGKMLFAKQAGTLEVNGKKIFNADIAAFQNNRKYYQKNDKRLFCLRIEKGRINVYKRIEKGSDGGVGNTHAAFFLQKGEGSELEPFSKKKLIEMVADYQPASHWLEKGVFKKDREDIYYNKAIRAYNTRD